MKINLCAKRAGMKTLDRRKIDLDVPVSPCLSSVLTKIGRRQQMAFRCTMCGMATIMIAAITGSAALHAQQSDTSVSSDSASPTEYSARLRAEMDEAIADNPGDVDPGDFLDCKTAKDSPKFNPCRFDAVRTINYIKNPKQDLIIVAAHRGLHATAGDTVFQGVPENSMRAIALAAKYGVEEIELDVKMSKDGSLVLSHDVTLGRETNWPNDDPTVFNDCSNSNQHTVCFNPFKGPDETIGGKLPNSVKNEAYNPKVEDVDLHTMRRLTLRDGISLKPKFPNQGIVTLREAYELMRDHDMQMVVALDVRDQKTARAAWHLAQDMKDKEGRPYSKYTMFKLKYEPLVNCQSGSAKDALRDIFGQDIKDALIQPVFDTKNAYTFYKRCGGGDPFYTDQETGLATSINVTLGDPNIGFVAIESQQKQKFFGSQGSNRPGNLAHLGDLLAHRRDKSLRSLTIFSPFKDLKDADGKSFYDKKGENKKPPYFYELDGHCCFTLPKTFFGGAPGMEFEFPGDTKDNRGLPRFVLNNLFLGVTTDDALGFRVAFDENFHRNVDKYLTPKQ